MKKIYVISSFIVLLLVSFLGITYSYEYNEDVFLKFELLGDYILNLDLNSEYVEYGVKVTYNGKDISGLVDIDSSMIDINRVGEYKVKYMVEIDETREYIYRIVKVRENVKPEITLKGEEIVYLDLDGKYIEPGYLVSDNYDVDIDKKVIVTSYLDVTKVGEYKIEYRVVDSSGNEDLKTRIVVVR